MVLLAVISPAQPTAAFEVASVKVAPPRTGRDRLTAMDTDQAMVRYSNISLSNLIAIAYRFDERLIVMPEGLDSERYDVAARVPEGAPKERVPEMMQTLLSERFKLAVHRESKEERVFFLVIGKGGSKLKPARPERGQNQIMRNGIMGHAMPVSILAASLARATDGTQVIDKTGLRGSFDIDLRYVPENSKEAGPDVYAALQEQLGLRLEKGRAAVERLVVGHVERIPTEN
jgi:uncharacterized protein (TIGR03435 family)